ncbi:hypothetical protein GGI12_000827 [Dipsacomyces acuminosporus]|nr:hypothetical protein GGI12_000827 [Dipsacomyces acuminosporus]
MSGHGYEAVGDGNIGVETQPISPTHNTSNDSIGYETTIPIHPKVLAPLSYILPVLAGLIVILLERRNTYVRLHAWQSVILSLVLYIGSLFFFWIPPVIWLIHLCGLITAVYTMFRAWKDAETLTFFKLGIIGDFAERQVLGSTILPF